MGACLITPQYIWSKLVRAASPSEEDGQEMGGGIGTILLTPEDINPQYKFCRYIHDQEALDQIADPQSPGTIWQEPPHMQFWLRPTPKHRALLQRTLALMKASPSNAKQATQECEGWMQAMRGQFPDLILASDVSNSDFNWLDHYRLVHLDLPSVNFFKGYFEPPINLGSYHSGLCSSNLQRFPLPRSFESICARYRLPVPRIAVQHDHCPINDSLLLGLQSMYLMVMLEQRTLAMMPASMPGGMPGGGFSMGGGAAMYGAPGEISYGPRGSGGVFYSSIPTRIVRVLSEEEVEEITGAESPGSEPSATRPEESRTGCP